MDFFESQDAARRSSYFLVLLFVLAVTAIVVATTLLVLLVAGQPLHQELGVFSRQNLQQQVPLMLTAAIGSFLVIVLASLFRSASLRSGGGKVARELGGQKLDADTRDPRLRQLRNVVEEVAIASGVAVPEIYVLEGEDGINAFAAGYTPSDAAIAVTRGTLEKLDRAELQGVIAHEFSHILNGDMRLNIRLMGLVFGILVLAIMGQRMLYGGFLFGGGRRRGGGKGAGAVLAIGIGLLVIGYIGLFFGRWIKSAVARRRESLADASAVQFTRNPEGLAGALKKIAVYSSGSLLEADTEEVHHMLFGESRAQSVFATHPPLLERIRAIEPDFQEQELKTLAQRLQREAESAKPPTEEEPTRETAQEGTMFDADTLIDRIGHVDQHGLAAAAMLMASLPAPLLDAARSAETAPALVLVLLLDADADVRARQLAAIREQLGAAAEQRVHEVMARHAGPPAPEHRLALLDTALPALKRYSLQYLDKFETLVQELAEVDQRISAFEFLLAQVLRGYLQDARAPSQTRTGHARLSGQQAHVAQTLNALAHFSNADDADAVAAAFAAGAASLDMDAAHPTDWPPSPDWPRQLRTALAALDKLTNADKKQLIRAWLATIMQDRVATPAERELLRAFCLAIHVPMPRLQ